jgi:uncharacterized membrane protein
MGVKVFVALVVALGAVALGVGFGPAVAEDHEDKEVVAEFNATGTSGFVEVNNDNADDPTAPLPTPEEVDQPIAINGEIYADGTVRTTKISFPTLGEEQLGLPVTVDIEAPEPFEGEIDREEGQLYLNGTLTITVLNQVNISVSANLTSGQSNGLTGETSGLDTGSATVTLVNNEYIIDETTGTIADSVLDLPSPEPGRNWFSLTLDMDIQTKTGTIEGVVESTAGEPIEGVRVTADGQETTTGSDGSYQLDVPVGSQELTAGRLGFATATRSVTAAEDETVTADFTLEPEEPGTIEGVVESTDGGPVGGATVSVGNQETTTAGDGSYQLDVAPDSAELTVEADGFAATSESITVDSGETATVDIQLEPGAPSFTPVIILADDVTAGDTVEVTGLVQNTGDRTGSQDVTLSVGDASATETPELRPGQLYTTSLTWETDSDDAGSYEATLTAGDSEPATTAVSVAGPSFNASVAAGNVAPGESLTVEATIRNEGAVSGSQNVTVSVADESTTETVQLGPGERTRVNLTWETGADEAGDYEATVDIGGQTITESVSVREDASQDVGDEVDFVARSTGGYMAYDYDSYSAAEGQGLEFPDVNAGEDPIVIAGKINEEEGTWESTKTNFPNIVQEGIEGTVRAPNGLHGKIDRDEGLLTASGQYWVLIEGRQDTSFRFNMTMRTDESGEITEDGKYEKVNDTFADINFVGNEFSVTEQTGDPVVDNTLKLPSPTAGRNYMELGFEVDFNPSPDEVDAIEEQETPNETAAETEANGTLFATLGQGLGGVGLVASVLFVLSGLYARVGRE